uniref:Uncharacterized protein n=3 Tax=Aegilops tauschii TaxID=37682 RepID=A0A453NNQ6_AEGTS
MQPREALQPGEISSSSAASSSLSSPAPDPIPPRNTSSPKKMEHSETPNSEEKGFPQLFMRQYDYDSVKAWIKKMEDEREEMDGIKELPPLEIIEFEDLMAEAWSPDRLLPWTCGIVHFRDYIAYLKKFFNSNVALHFDLHAAAKRCLKMEKSYMENGNIHQGNLTLEIQNVAENIMKERKSEGQFAVAAAGLVVHVYL